MRASATTHPRLGGRPKIGFRSSSVANSRIDRPKAPPVRTWQSGLVEGKSVKRSVEANGVVCVEESHTIGADHPHPVTAHFVEKLLLQIAP